MKYIREYRKISNGEYIYEFEITGICTDNDPHEFNLVKTNKGYFPIEETDFFEIWNLANYCGIETEIATKFIYLNMTQSKEGFFILLISDAAESDAATLVLNFGDYINRDY